MKNQHWPSGFSSRWKTNIDHHQIFHLDKKPDDGHCWPKHL